MGPFRIPFWISSLGTDVVDLKGVKNAPIDLKYLTLTSHKSVSCAPLLRINQIFDVAGRGELPISY